MRAQLRDESRAFWVWLFIVSFFFHGIVIAGIWGMERLTPHRRPPSVISVQLVASVSDGSSVEVEQDKREKTPPAKASARDTGKRLPVPQARRKLVSVRPKDVEPPPRPKPKPPPKPSPKRRIAKPSPPSQARTVQKDPVAALKRQSGASAGGTAGRAGKFTRQERDYTLMLEQRIRENWRAYLAPGEELLGKVRIVIAADGRIREIDLVKGSGKSHVDDSILRALRNTALPPPPRSLADQPLLLRFWPSGS